MTRRATSGVIPPFGRAVIAARQRGATVNLFIFCGSCCWDMARFREHAVAVPTPDDGRRADWRPIVGGLSGVTLVARGWSEGDVDLLARQLVRDGAKLVITLRVDSSEGVIRVERDTYRLKRRIAA